VVLDDAELGNLKQFGLQPVPLNDKHGFQLALTNRLDILNNIDKFEDKKRKVEVAANDLLPSLAVVANYSLKDQFYNRNSFDFGDYSGKIGLSLDLPLDKHIERNAYRKSRITFEQQLRSLMKTLDDLRDEIRTNVRTLAQNRQTYIINQKALIVAERERERRGWICWPANACRPATSSRPKPPWPRRRMMSPNRSSTFTPNG
jgi:outer membrane protein TolC